jgi:taurine-pyruvate aminotransferase
MGDYMLDQLRALQDKHSVIGDVRGKGLFLGVELVSDRVTRDAADEKMVQAVVGDCMKNAVIIGATNRSVPGHNNTLCFSPALIATKDDINQIVSAVDGALGRVFG